jgi:demethylphylloquinone reductase
MFALLEQPIVNICILGGGFGGLYTALYLSNFWMIKSGKCKITLIDEKDRFLFTPLVYELLTKELQAWQIAPFYEKILKSKNIKFRQEKIYNVNLNNRLVELENKEKLSYDYLVLAGGSQTKWINIPGLADYALSFRTLKDAELLLEKIQTLEVYSRKCLQIAVIGGGANGVELACKLADRLGKRGKIHLIEKGDTILKNFSSKLRFAAYRALRQRRVQVNLKTNVSQIEAEQIILLCDRQNISIAVDLVLWTGGSESVEWISKINCQQNSQGKVLTLPTLQLVDRPEVFALGDMAFIENYPKPIPATAQAAYQQARCLAGNIKAALTGRRLQNFRYRHLGDMLTLGKDAAVVSSYFLNLEGLLAATIRKLVYLQRLPTCRHRLQVLKNLIFFHK